MQSIPRTLLVEIRFRSRDAALSAAVANALMRAYSEQETESEIQATAQASGWLGSQLTDLKAQVDRDQQRLSLFEAQHGIVSAPEVLANGESGETEHSSALLELDELSRQLVAATSDRILAEAEYRAASQGDPETVIASDPRLQADSVNFATTLLEQIRAHRSDLEQEQAQLSAEHGPSFPRVVEISRQLQDLDRQKQAEDPKLVDHFRSNWQTALDREQLLRKSLDQATGEGMKLSQAATQYAVMRQEANSSHDLYLRVQEKAEEAGLAAGVRSSNISVVDYARQPDKPIAPDLPLYLAITFFVGLWIAVAAALLRESLSPRAWPTLAVVIALLLAGASARAQAPTPSTSGLPTGVATFPQTQETKSLPNPKEAPTIWDNAGPAPGTLATPLAAAPASVPMPAPIGPGDFLDISEYHTPEFHSTVRVAAEGTVTLPMIGEVKLLGMDEQAAARAIEVGLVAKGMLLHPLVSVLVTSYAGQDVSVLGEVARPGVYPYTVHHRLLDLISAASGLSPNAGRLVNVFHQSDPKTPHAVVLDPSGTDTGVDHNPELSPGDTVQVSRAGLVYVVGDVVRPGGFPVDPVQGLTVVQALSLAWGPSQNAAVQSRAHSRAEGRPNDDLPEPEAHVSRPGPRPARRGPRHPLCTRFRREKSRQPDAGVGHSVHHRRHYLLRVGLLAEVLRNEKSRVVPAPALCLRHSMGVLTRSGRASGQRGAYRRPAGASRRPSRRPSSRPHAHAQRVLVDHARALSLVLLHILLDHRSRRRHSKRSAATFRR